MSTKLLLLFFSLFPLCFSCNCPIDSGGKSRFEVICDSYDNSNGIYVVRITAAYCKCRLPSSTNRFSCMEFMPNQTIPELVIPSGNTVVGSVEGTYECQDFGNSTSSSYYRNCSDVIKDAGITNMAESAELLNEAVTEPVMNLNTCQDFPFIDDENRGGCALTVQPCYYTVLVTDRYKGSRHMGDTFNTSGPDLLTSCSGPNRVLTVGESYVLGVGGPCYIIRDWGLVNDFSTLEFDILFSLRNTGRSTECPGTIGLTGAQVAIVTVVVIIYVAIIVVLLVVAAVLSLKCKDDKTKKRHRQAVIADDESKDALQNVTDDINSNDEKETVLLSSKSTDI
uniref:Uncharacterized protein n=1 Tax=Amphimedon queenslandica TaxID=400682 RepID=A0A1X7VLZ3_AMPQE